MDKCFNTLHKNGIIHFAKYVTLLCVKENDEDFFNTPVGDACRIIFEDSTGHPIREIKRLIEKAEVELLEKAENEDINIFESAPKMTLSELSKKYDKSKQQISFLLKKNNIVCKTDVKKNKLYELENTLKAFNGKLTIDEMAEKTGCTSKQIRNLCYQKQIEYKRKNKCSIN